MPYIRKTDYLFNLMLIDIYVTQINYLITIYRFIQVGRVSSSDRSRIPKGAVLGAEDDLHVWTVHMIEKQFNATTIGKKKC